MLRVGVVTVSDVLTNNCLCIMATDFAGHELVGEANKRAGSWYLLGQEINWTVDGKCVRRLDRFSDDQRVHLVCNDDELTVFRNHDPGVLVIPKGHMVVEHPAEFRKPLDGFVVTSMEGGKEDGILRARCWSKSETEQVCEIWTPGLEERMEMWPEDNLQGAKCNVDDAPLRLLEIFSLWGWVVRSMSIGETIRVE